nr:hypothetical protein [Tanacetum cinerariifolium]
MSRRSNYKLVTLFFDPERHFHARKNLTQIFVHNIFSFYESDASKLKFEEVGEVDIDTLTMKQYMALTRGNHRPGVVRHEIANNVNFKIKGQFMKELRDNIFFLGIVRTMLEHMQKVEAKRWKHGLPTGLINTWSLLEKAFIQKYCSPSKTATQLEEIHNFKQEDNETFYPSRALVSIQDMADHSPKWHNRASNRSISSNSSDGIAAITNKLDNLGRDMRKLKENIHAIQVDCEIFGGMHLVKEYPLKEEVKGVEEAKYGELGRPFPNNSGNEARYRIGTLGYYNKMETRPPFGERKSSLQETINKYLEEPAKKQTERDERLGKFQENTDVNLKSHDEAIKYLDTKIGLLTNDVQVKITGGAPSSLTLVSYCKAIWNDLKAIDVLQLGVIRMAFELMIDETGCAGSMCGRRLLIVSRVRKWKKMKLFQDMQLIQKLRDDQKRMKKDFKVVSRSYV